MCGITVFAQKIAAIDKVTFELTAASMAHRGPDGTNTELLTSENGCNYALGHNLLHITGILSDAIQPMSDNTGRYRLIFNGEIYNYQELKGSELFKDTILRTDTDTEVLLQLLIKHRLQGLEQVAGMYAFVLVDLETDTVVITRDHAGIKPLFYSHIEGKFIVTSELQAQAKALNGKALINSKQIPEYLLYKHAAAPETLIQDVFEVMPGEYIIWQNGNISKGQTTQYIQKTGEGHLYTPRIKALLDQAIKAETYGIENPAILLSGGIDSTLMLAMMQKEGIKKITTYTALPAYVPDEDASFAHQASEQYGATNVPIRYDVSILNFLPEYAKRLSAPVADTAGLLTWWITRNEVNALKVLYSGAGADELFGGYNRHQAFHYYMQFHRSLKTGFMKFIIQVLGVLTNRNSQFGFLAQSIRTNPGDTFKNLTATGGWQQKELLIASTVERSPINERTFPEWMQFALNYDREQYLVGDVLSITDSAAMMNGKEVRVPFLHAPLYKEVAQREAVDLLAYGKKWTLKEILNKLNGKKYTKRLKKGFGIDFTNYLKSTEHKPQIDALLQKDHWLHQFVNKQAIEKHIEQLNQGKQGAAQSIISLLILDYWVQENQIITMITSSPKA